MSSRGETEAEDKSAVSSPTDIESPASGATTETVEVKEEQQQPDKKEPAAPEPEPVKKTEEVPPAATRVEEEKKDEMAAVEKPVDKVVEVSRAVEASNVCSLQARTKPIATPSIIERKTSEELPSSCTLPSSPPPTPIDPSPLQQHHQHEQITSTALAEAFKSTTDTQSPSDTVATATTPEQIINQTPISNVPLTANVQIVEHHSIVEPVGGEAAAQEPPPLPRSPAPVTSSEPVVVVEPAETSTAEVHDEKVAPEVTPSESARTKFFMETLSTEETNAAEADGEADRSQNSMTFELVQEKTFVVESALPTETSEQADDSVSEPIVELQSKLDDMSLNGQQDDVVVEDLMKLSVEMEELKAAECLLEEDDDVKINGTSDNAQELKQVNNHTRNKNKNRNRKRKAKKN